MEWIIENEYSAKGYKIICGTDEAGRGPLCGNVAAGACILPYGVDIPTVFLNHNHCLDDEQVPREERDPEYDKARRAYLVNLARRVPQLQDAAHCTGCGKCVKLCPQFIDIPGEMARLGKFAEDLRLRG